MEETYVKVPIYPDARWLNPKERGGIPANKIPQVFEFAGDTIHVTKMEVCERSVSRKAGGRGFRFVCRVCWQDGDEERNKLSVIWYDDFYDEWFVEVPLNWATSKGLEYQEFDYTAKR